jgi:NhaP-type Na+/H+ or K+/H+ antiporter
MNTKFFFLLIVSLLIATSTASIVTNKKEVATTAETQTSADNAKPAKDHTSKEDVPLTNDFHKDSNHAEKDHRTTEDGKHHHFHFSRLTARKRKKFVLLFLSKLILTIAHVCCFIYCFLHVFH